MPLICPVVARWIGAALLAAVEHTPPSLTYIAQMPSKLCVPGFPIRPQALALLDSKELAPCRATVAGEVASFGHPELSAAAGDLFDSLVAFSRLVTTISPADAWRDFELGK